MALELLPACVAQVGNLPYKTAPMTVEREIRTLAESETSEWQGCMGLTEGPVDAFPTAADRDAIPAVERRFAPRITPPSPPRRERNPISVPQVELPVQPDLHLELLGRPLLPALLHQVHLALLLHCVVLPKGLKSTKTENPLQLSLPRSGAVSRYPVVVLS